VVNLQVGKAHLDAFALVARHAICLCPHQPARDVTGIFMNIAWHLSRRPFGTALHLEGTDFAVELGSAIAKLVAFMHGAAGVQHLAVWADVDALPTIPAEVAARECAIVAFAGVADWDVRDNPDVNEPVQEGCRLTRVANTTLAPRTSPGEFARHFSAPAPQKLSATTKRAAGLFSRRTRLVGTPRHDAADGYYGDKPNDYEPQRDIGQIHDQAPSCPQVL
jgi:hypothetical protein